MVEGNRYDVIMIGAGHNGLVTSGYLARSGLSVLVLERLDKIGGATTTDEFAPGFWGPMCSYSLHGLRGKIIDDLKLKDHGLEIARRSQVGGLRLGFHPFPDGTFLGGPNIRSDLDMANQIREFSENDARRYFDWTSFWDDAGAIISPYFLTEPPSMAELFESVRGTRQEEKLVTWSMIELLDDHFEDERVRAHFIRSPESDVRSAGSMLGPAMRYAENAREEDRGIPKGSMGAVTASMASSIRDMGAEIRTRSPVQKVLVENGSAVGVRLASGEEIRADVVVSNADPKRTFSTFFETDELSEETTRRVKRWKTQAGSVKFLAGMKELPDFSGYLGSDYDRNAILSVRIMPSVDYHLQSWDDCMAGRPSTCPIMSIQLTSVADPDLVRRGDGHVMSNWVLYENPVLSEGSWSSVREEIGERIIDGITEYAPNFRDSLVEWTVQTPEDIETRVGMTDGNIRHLDEIPSQLLDQRQPYRTEIGNFYMCGAGTHPEGEVTGAPGHNAAHAILRDLERIT